MLQSFLAPFLTIFVAEILDKSQLALIFLSTKTKRILPLLLGSILAFAIVDGTAVIFGSFIASIVPGGIVRFIAGSLFILFGLLSFRKEDGDKQTKLKTKNLFVSAFLLVFLSEWGDKTQLASAAFATQFQPYLVFAGVMAAMTILSVLAIFAGRFIATRINKSLIQKVAGGAFILIGLYLLFFS